MSALVDEHKFTQYFKSKKCEIPVEHYVPIVALEVISYCVEVLLKQAVKDLSKPDGFTSENDLNLNFTVGKL